MEQSQEHQSGKPDRALEATATSLGIAPENRNHPVVRQFVGFVNQVQDLQLGLTSAVSQSPATKEALEAGLPPAPHEMDVLPSLHDRYDAVELLLRAAGSILRDGFGNTSFITEDESMQKYLASRVNSALNRYGLKVVKDEEPGPQEPLPANPRERLKIVK